MGANSRRFEFWKWTTLAYVALARSVVLGTLLAFRQRRAKP